MILICTYTYVSMETYRIYYYMPMKPSMPGILVSSHTLSWKSSPLPRSLICPPPAFSPSANGLFNQQAITLMISYRWNGASATESMQITRGIGPRFAQLYRPHLTLLLFIIMIHRWGQDKVWQPVFSFSVNQSKFDRIMLVSMFIFHI